MHLHKASSWTRAWRLAPVLLLAFIASASAADWPSRPIHLIVPYPPGGGTDLVARMVGPKLAEALRQPVVIENRVGANGAIAQDYVAKSPADGYTISFDSMSVVITPIISKVPYDPVRDLQPVAQLLSQAFVIVSTPGLPVKNMRDLMKASKDKPGGLNAAAPGASTRLAAELFKLTTNADLTFIPYKGGSQATLAIMSGETDVGFMDVPSVLSSVQSGKMNAVAVTTASRVKLMPDVPTTSEAGLPDYRVDSWIGAFMAANTPPDIVARLNTEINAALRSPDVIAKIQQLGGEASQSSVAEFTKLYRSEIDRWTEVVVRSKVKIE
ncbi:tripartite tricarboxylate transporter substrate binding protein [soil metagenome]